MKLKYLSETELIFNDQTGKEYSIKFPIEPFCPFCARPISNKDLCTNHHKFLEKKNLQLICGGYYQTDAHGEPQDWWTRELKNVTEFPFQYSSSLIEFVIKSKIELILPMYKKIMATMVPTTYLQAEEIYKSISNTLNISFENLFVKNNPDFINDRTEYIKQKYSLAEINDNFIQTINSSEAIIIFDDILHTGTTLGYCAELLRQIYPNTIILCSLGRTLGKKRSLITRFPRL